MSDIICRDESTKVVGNLQGVEGFRDEDRACPAFAWIDQHMSVIAHPRAPWTLETVR